MFCFAPCTASRSQVLLRLCSCFHFTRHIKGKHITPLSFLFLTLLPTAIGSDQLHTFSLAGLM